MASNSSASTLKISGTSVNTVWVDDNWTEWSPKPESAKPVYLEFNTNPLALVCAMIRNGKQPYEVVETLNGVGRQSRPIDASRAIEPEDVDRANTILRYFAKKHTMRRVKSEWISKYMLSIDEIVDNPKRINKEYVPILVTLPRIYEQNLALERVMKGRKSVPSEKSSKTLDFPSFEGVVEFVDKVNIKAGRNNEMHYFFSTPNNYLMRVVVKKGEYGATAWDFIAKQGKLHINVDSTYIFGVRGYDFNVIQPSPEDIEINIA